MPVIIGTLVGAAVLLGMIPILFVCALYHAWVLSYLWEWFMVPLGLPQLTIAQLVGVMFVKAMVFYKVENGVDLKKHWLTALIVPLFALLVAYIWRFWVM